MLRLPGTSWSIGVLKVFYDAVVILILFCLQCHVSCVPVFNSMRRKEIKPWGFVVTLSMIICLFVYTGTGKHSVMHFIFQFRLTATDFLQVFFRCPVRFTVKCRIDRLLWFLCDQVSVVTWHLAPAWVRTCWCRTLLMMWPWRSQELSLSSAWSPRTPFYISAAGKVQLKHNLVQ